MDETKYWRMKQVLRWIIVTLGCIIATAIIVKDSDNRQVEKKERKGTNLVEWQKYNSKVDYAKVKGGWLLKFAYKQNRLAITFYPDYKHLWNGKSPLNNLTKVIYNSPNNMIAKGGRQTQPNILALATERTPNGR